ncbi:MAG TPA: transglutaminase-like domain-containing protein [Vicinamibacterales bacterium]|jgi:regulator of sirC expression with transglutaminase-like and TPR domain|nr:transglutaminase-like domain-containing protein [Vicinamibacterales bacterium]
MLSTHAVQAFAHAALSPDPDLAVAALMIARTENPGLEAGPYLDRLDELGREARQRVEAASARGDAPPLVDPGRFAAVMALNSYIFQELRFVGNDLQYEDPRNSFLNEVMDRRTGIPITLALLYMEVARRAGVHVEGINFPGHFLLRSPARRGQPYARDLIFDAFHGGAVLSEDACRELLRRHAGDDDMLEKSLRGHATKPQILARMLVNLKRVYVRMHSFPQARDMTELLLAVDPTATSELRDRGLLAYHLNDFAAALRDLQRYLQLAPKQGLDEEERSEHEQIWEHVKTLRRRVASLN